MTIAELERAIESKKRQRKLEAQEKALMDYTLADLIGRSIGRLYSSAASMPEISAVYPSLFDNQDIEVAKSEKQTEISAIRFKQFAKIHNDRLKSNHKEVASNK